MTILLQPTQAVSEKFQVKEQQTMSEEEMQLRNKKLTHLESIKDSIFPVIMKIKEAKVVSEKEFRYLQDQLEKCHLELDKVEALGDEEVRKKRKSIAVMVSTIFNLLDAKAEKVPTLMDQTENVNHMPNDSNSVGNDKFSHFVQRNDLKNSEDSNADEESSTEIEDNSDETKETEDIATTTHPDNSIAERDDNDCDKNSTAQSQNSCDNCDETRKKENHSPTKQLDRMRMEVFENRVRMSVDVSDMVDLKLTIEDGEVIVTGTRAGERVRVSRRLPSNCLPNRAQSRLSSDGVLLISVPRRTDVHQMRRLPFWF